MDGSEPQGRFTSDGVAGHEPNRLSAQGLVYFAVALVGVTLLVLLVLALVMRGFSREEKDLESLALPRFAGDAGEYPAPRIQADPSDELKKMKSEDLANLNNYGWVDRKAGVVHIPIERAMDILAKKGLPSALERGAKPGETVESAAGGVPQEPPKKRAEGEPK